MKNILSCLPLLLLASCDNMDHQPRYDSYEESTLFTNGKALQTPPDGVVASDDEIFLQELTNRPPMSIALLQRGRERYEIYCMPCHDAAGYGNGRIPSRGFPHPPSLHVQRLRDAPSAYVVNVITHGHGVMYSYADRVAPKDRWAIAAYVKALQLSRDAPPAALATVKDGGAEARP